MGNAMATTALAAAFFATAAHAAPTAPAATPVAVRQAKFGGFWSDANRRLGCKWLPHCVKAQEEGGKGEELLNLVATAKLLKGDTAHFKYRGTPWADAYIYNTIEAICLALEIDPGDDKELASAQDFLRGKLERWIEIVLSAQEPCGYIHSYHDLNKREHFKDASKHEFYVMGYFIEAGVAHMRMTQGRDRRLFDAAVRCADHLDSIFGPPPKRTWLNGHPGLEYALCRLADAVDKDKGAGAGEKYSRLAAHFIDNQHASTAGNDGWNKAYHQADMPARQMKNASGHAVRATYFYTAMSALARRLGDTGLGEADDRLFESAIDRKEYLTGGVGAAWRGEAFMGDYELANSGYCESCASCGMAFWTLERRWREPGTKPSAVFERLLYNNLLGSVSADGETFFYQNPLDSDKMRAAWHVCPCCVGNIPRTVFSLKDRTYFTSADGKTLFVEQFASLDGARAILDGTETAITQTTAYPWKGDVAITLKPAKPVRFTLAIRLPDRTESPLYTAAPDLSGEYTLEVRGKESMKTVKDGYVCIDMEWKSGDTVELSFPVTVQRIRCDGRVAANKGRVAFQRGPVVYNFEQIDQRAPLDSLESAPDAAIEESWMPELWGGVLSLKTADGLVAIPNFARLNRARCRSIVWIKEKEKAK